MLSGGVRAHSEEPHGGPSHGGPSHGVAPVRCLNCGTALIGEHCHACGQAAHVHRTVGALGHDIAHGVFHVEGKAWHTLPMLALRPGELTRRYIDGERARFVSPIALFLFSIFLLFAIVANLPLVHMGDGDFLKGGIASRAAETRIELGKQRKEAAEDVADTRRDLADEQADSEPNRARIDRLTVRLAEQQALARQVAAAERALPAVAPKHAGGTVTFNGPAAGWLEAKWKHATENPKLLLYKVKSSAYKFSWALVPLSIPFVWLLFPFSRRFGLYDHAVFVTYSLTFMSLLFTLAALLVAAGAPWWLTVNGGLLIATLHIYKQLKGTYRLRRVGALVRTVVLTSFILWLIVPAFALGLIYLGIAG